ncbi:MAG: tyrosine--tRNA ligase [Firmicutes bacterium]|nr:tyrosine--tRNA ligase [Bacillota bacterium]
MPSVYDVLLERGFVRQVTHEEALRELLEKEQVTFYIGFDPTADSLHVGHVLPLMAMAHLQRAGHRAIALLGAGTAMIGDPTGRTEMRRMLTREAIAANAERFKEQIGRYLALDGERGLLLDNSEWLLPLNYIGFLREIGVHFSVNRMLEAECFRTRMERGLSFIEFNYMLLQAYDFLVLHRRYGCRLQMGGDDQWSNILAGADLIRRVEGAEAFGLTFPLLTTSSGRKMGKTEAGAVWLDPAKTSPYEFYQYWRNTEDADVMRFLALYTFLPMEEVRRLGSLRDRAINEAKKVLAFEVTKLAHGEEAAARAQAAAEALFEGAGDGEGVPTSVLRPEEVGEAISILDLLVRTGLAPTRSEARRLIDQGGVAVGGEKVESITAVLPPEKLQGEGVILRKGKKGFHRVRIG